MNKAYLPNEDYMMIRWTELEQAWRMLASPEKLHQIETTIQTIRVLDRQYGPEKAVFNMIAASAWLTDDRPSSADGWEP